MKKIQKITILATVLAIMVFIIIYSSDVKQGIVNGLVMCANILIPSLFPFTVLSLFLTNSGLIFYISKPINTITQLLFKMSGEEFCVFVLSLLGGYPVGALLVNQLVENKTMDKDRANKFYLFCFGAGPSFIILAVGEGILNSKTLGLLILTSQIITSTIISFVCLKRNDTIRNHNKLNKQTDTAQAFIDATYQGAINIFKICIYVVLFSAITNTTKILFSEYKMLSCLTLPLEITNGVLNADKNVYLICFLIGFGGFCIHMQVYSLMNKKIKYAHYFCFRVLHGTISCLILKILLLLFPQSINTISNNVNFGMKVSYISIWSSLALLLMSICLLYSAKKGGKNEKSVL